MKFVLAALVLALGLLLSPSGHAGGLESQMQKTLGSMVNTTDPSFSMTARRGVISGGGIVVKNRIMNTSLVNFTPPYIHAGCGGWDLFGGSFSFISSEQIVAMLRSIASNAISYAFHLALSTISEKVDNILTELAAKMDAMNMNQINSCKVGMALVDSFKDGNSKGLADSLGMNFMSDTGQENDESAASEQGEEESAAVKAAAIDPDVHDAIIEGNLVWKALKHNGAADWIDGGSDEFLRQVMSLTGTTIVCKRGEHDCVDDGAQPVAGQETLISYGREPILTLRDLVEGTQTGNEVSIYRCADADECLNPKATPEGDFTGAEKMILDRILGTTGNYYEPGAGLLGRYAALNGAPSTADRQAIAAFGDYMAMAMRLARTNEHSARQFVQDFSPQIAAELVYTIVDEALNSTMQATTTYKAGMSKDGQAAVMRARQQLREDYREYMQQHEVDTTRFTYFRALMEEMDKSRGILPQPVN